MKNTTYLFFPSDGSQPEIIKQDPESKQSPLNIAILPAELCSSFIRDCPPAQQKYLSKTLPYLVEESIATPIDNMHCVSQSIGNSQIRVFTISRTTLLHCLKQAEALELKLDQLYIDADLIPDAHDANSPSVICCNGRRLVKTSKGLIAAMRAQHSDAHIEELIAQAADQSEGQSEGQSSQQQESDIEHYQALCIEGSQRVIDSCCSPLNLLQGEFAPGQTAAARAATVHKLIMLAMVVLLVQVSYWLIAGSTFEDKAQALKQQSEATYHQLFPDDKKIIDLVAQAEGHLSQINSTTDELSFLALLGELGKAIKASDATSTILLKSVHYEKPTGQLRAELVANNILALERVHKELETKFNFATETDHISENPSATDEFPANMRLTLKSRSKGARK